MFERGPTARYGLLFAGGAGLYVGAAKLGIELSVARGVVTPVWAPTGIALALLILFGWRLWPAVALGAFIANAISGASIGEAAFISVGNTLEAVVGALLLARVGFRPALDRVRDVLVLIGLGALAPTTIAATNGVTTLWAFGDVAGGDYGSNWLLWWIGDAMGALIVTPLLLVWSAAPVRNLRGARAAEAFLLVGLLVGLSCLVFLGGLWKYPHLLFPLLIWAPLRFRQPGAVTGNFIVAAIAIAGAVNGTTPIGAESTTTIVQILEGLLAGSAVATLLLGAVLSERSTTQADLERAGASLAEAQSIAGLGSWDWDIHANHVTWSDELFRLYALEPQAIEVTFEAYLERVHPDDRERVASIVGLAHVDRQPFEFDHRIMRTDGAVRWHHSRGRVELDAGGEPVRMRGTAQDITDRKRLDELRNNILAAVSHELRTPLTAIRGFALTLQERGQTLDEATRAEIVGHLVQQSAKLERLLGDLLDLDRIRHGLVAPSSQPTDVGALARRIAGEYASNGHPIEVQAASVMADIDPPKVERILDNLLGNAIKHTPGGTTIRVRVEESDANVLLAVDDRGPGVPDQDRQAIFELFNRGRGAAETAPPGAGVGLSLVAQFAGLHGGRVWVEENADGGASFNVLLPRERAGSST
jgi:signal transduction histidine kinase